MHPSGVFAFVSKSWILLIPDGEEREPAVSSCFQGLEVPGFTLLDDSTDSPTAGYPCALSVALRAHQTSALCSEEICCVAVLTYADTFTRLVEHMLQESILIVSVGRRVLISSGVGGKKTCSCLHPLWKSWPFIQHQPALFTSTHNSREMTRKY